MDWSLRNVDESYWPRAENLEGSGRVLPGEDSLPFLPRNERVSIGSWVSSHAEYCK